MCTQYCHDLANTQYWQLMLVLEAYRIVMSSQIWHVQGDQKPVTKNLPPPPQKIELTATAVLVHSIGQADFWTGLLPWQARQRDSYKGFRQEFKDNSSILTTPKEHNSRTVSRAKIRFLSMRCPSRQLQKVSFSVTPKKPWFRQKVTSSASNPQESLSPLEWPDFVRPPTNQAPRRKKWWQ